MNKAINIFLIQLLSIFLLQDSYICAPSLEELEFVNQIESHIPSQIQNQNSADKPELVNYKHLSIKNPKYHVDIHHAIANDIPVNDAQKTVQRLDNEGDAEYLIVKKKERKTTTKSPESFKGG